jgi:uncharacterized protein (DUF983 family)
MVIPEIIYSTATNTCPRCHKGNVFKNNNPYSFNNGLTMLDSCSECNLKYEREPGFFYGALYVSYAFMSGIFIIWFVADLLWIHMDSVKLAMVVMVSMLLLFPVVYRSARILWLNFFIRFDKKYANKKQALLQDNVKLKTTTQNGKF